MMAIVDCNSFYCSCEKVFKPALEHSPVVVLSNNDGCIIARSDEAKALGLNMTGPYFMAKPILEQHDVAVFSSNYNLYGDMSRRVMDVLKHFVGEENVEVYSVDEAFLTLDDFKPEQLLKFATDIRYTVEKWTGVHVSIGIAATKTLAKMVNRVAKANKRITNCVMVLETEQQLTKLLKSTPVGDIWGIGSRYADKLKSLEILTAWDLSKMSEEWARTHMGGVVGVRLIKELNGQEAIVMKDQLVTKKVIATTRMFGKVVTNFKDIQEAVATYTARAAEKLRRQQSAARIIEVFLISQEKIDSPRFKHGPTASVSKILLQPTSCTNELIKPVVQMAEQLFQEGKKYKNAGVILSGLVPDDSIQANMFAEGKGSAGRYLMDMVDNINFSMRDDIVKFASSGTGKRWRMQQNFHSPRYTTRWDEIPEVK
ncbi:MAG: Y-family DNA polymerase [Chitinophagaceae bacterium]